MSVNMYKLNYQNLYDHVSESEFDFIDSCITFNTETCSYYICQETLTEALKTAKRKRIKIPKELVKCLKEQIKVAESFDIQIF